MRIALISAPANPLAGLDGPDARGQHVHVAELARTLAGAGHDVRVYTRRAAPEPPTPVDLAPGAQLEYVPAGPARPIARDKLRRYMNAFGTVLANRWADGWRPDVVHAHFWPSGLAALRATRDHRSVPVVLTYHALGSVRERYEGTAGPGPADRIDVERTLGQQVARVVARSTDEVTELVQLGVPRRSITVVPSGVDTALFHPAHPAAPRGDRPRILAVGPLEARKGLADVVQALRMVPDAELVVAGGPPPPEVRRGRLARQFWTQVRRAGVTGQVRLLGSVPHEQLPAWYTSADVFVSAPWYEPFGLTPLEAMACGVPVVATAVGGIRDTVVHGVTGLLVSPRDPRALGLALRRLLGDEFLRVAYGNGGRDRATARFDWSRTTAELVQVYEAVAAQCRATVAA